MGNFIHNKRAGAPGVGNDYFTHLDRGIPEVEQARVVYEAGGRGANAAEAASSILQALVSSSPPLLPPPPGATSYVPAYDTGAGGYAPAAPGAYDPTYGSPTPSFIGAGNQQPRPPTPAPQQPAAPPPTPVPTFAERARDALPDGGFTKVPGLPFGVPSDSEAQFWLGEKAPDAVRAIAEASAKTLGTVATAPVSFLSGLVNRLFGTKETSEKAKRDLETTQDILTGRKSLREVLGWR